MKTNYVAGFMFDAARENVALIEKQKPDWQKGKLNGIGGKIEEGESPVQAMVREFEEETGCRETLWRWYCDLKFQGATIHFFMCIGDLSELCSMEGEQVRIVPVADIPRLNTIPNLRWLVPMAIDKDRVTSVVEDQS